MSDPLQAKDDQWRNRRANSSAPVFDPGLSPPGTDEEAGGARAAKAPHDQAERPPLPTAPDVGGGVRLTPRFWYAVAAAIALLLIVAGAWSMRG